MNQACHARAHAYSLLETWLRSTRATPLHRPMHTLTDTLNPPQDELAPVALGVQPVEQRRARASHVQVAGGGGREAHAHLRRTAPRWDA